MKEELTTKTRENLNKVFDHYFHQVDSLGKRLRQPDKFFRRLPQIQANAKSTPFLEVPDISFYHEKGCFIRMTMELEIEGEGLRLDLRPKFDGMSPELGNRDIYELSQWMVEVAGFCVWMEADLRSLLSE